MRNEAYFSYAAMTNNKRNAADECFWTACLHKQSPFPEPLTTLRKTKPLKQCARLQPAARVPAAKGIILIHHDLELLTLKHCALSRNKFTARAGQHEFGIEYSQKARLLRHGLGKIKLIDLIVFSARRGPQDPEWRAAD